MALVLRPAPAQRAVNAVAVALPFVLATAWVWRSAPRLGIALVALGVPFAWRAFSLSAAVGDGVVNVSGLLRNRTIPIRSVERVSAWPLLVWRASPDGRTRRTPVAALAKSSRQVAAGMNDRQEHAVARLRKAIMDGR